MPVMPFSGHPLSWLLLTGWAHVATNVYAVQGRIVTYSCVCKTASMLEAQLRSLYSAARPSHAEFKVYNPVQLPTLLQAIKVILCKQLLCYLKNKLKKPNIANGIHYLGPSLHPGTCTVTTALLSLHAGCCTGLSWQGILPLMARQIQWNLCIQILHRYCFKDVILCESLWKLLGWKVIYKWRYKIIIIEHQAHGPLCTAFVWTLS